jgi:hypothetical protein
MLMNYGMLLSALKEAQPVLSDNYDRHLAVAAETTGWTACCMRLIHLFEVLFSD